MCSAHGLCYRSVDCLVVYRRCVLTGEHNCNGRNRLLRKGLLEILRLLRKVGIKSFDSQPLCLMSQTGHSFVPLLSSLP